MKADGEKVTHPPPPLNSRQLENCLLKTACFFCQKHCFRTGPHCFMDMDNDELLHLIFQDTFFQILLYYSILSRRHAFLEQLETFLSLL